MQSKDSCRNWRQPDRSGRLERARVRPLGTRSARAGRSMCQRKLREFRQADLARPDLQPPQSPRLQRPGWQFPLIAIAPAYHVQIRWVDRAQQHSDERFGRGQSRDLRQFQYALRFTGLAKDQCFHQYLAIVGTVHIVIMEIRGLAAIWRTGASARAYRCPAAGSSIPAFGAVSRVLRPLR